MSGVLQSGNVTAGHYATWTTDGVLQDGGSALAAQKVLGSLRNADFNSSSDQLIQIPVAIRAFSITGIIVTNASISLTTARGGFYSATGQSGVAIVASSQVYSSLTGPDVLLNATVGAPALATRWSGNNLTVLPILSGVYALYLSLTTVQGAAATADCYVWGIDLS